MCDQPGKCGRNTECGYPHCRTEATAGGVTVRGHGSQEDAQATAERLYEAARGPVLRPVEAYFEPAGEEPHEPARAGGPPKTRLVMHARAGVCVGPGTTPIDLFIEDTATGRRTKLGGGE